MSHGSKKVRSLVAVERERDIVRSTAMIVFLTAGPDRTGPPRLPADSPFTALINFPFHPFSLSLSLSPVFFNASIVHDQSVPSDD